MTVITMSRNELTRLRVLIDVDDSRLSVSDATGLIGVGRRQIYRLLDAFRIQGADGLIMSYAGASTRSRPIGSPCSDAETNSSGMPSQRYRPLGLRLPQRRDI